MVTPYFVVASVAIFLFWGKPINEKQVMKDLHPIAKGFV
ncbi:hypothetical protein FM109_09600 [Vibrio casei]|nr:hypothetical protein FM109_09600 [Vibrio casei]